MPTSLTGMTIGTVKLGLVPRGYSTGSQVVALETVDTLVSAVRARTLATLTELRQVPETLNRAVQLSQANLLPVAVIVVQKGADVSDQWAVFDTAQIIPVDLVLCVLTDTTGRVDTAQASRKRLGVLQSAFLSDRRLGGVVTQTTVRNVPESKVNEYANYFEEQGQFVTVMALGLDFTMVQSVLQNA